MSTITTLDPRFQLPIEQLTYEEALSQLEEIVALLETGEGHLDLIISLFERGQMLVNYCSDLLDKAELKVQTIIGDQLSDFNPQETAYQTSE